MSEWQPIETVPKDGSRVLLFTDHGIVEARYEKCQFCDIYWWHDWDIVVVEAHDDCWLKDKPTHWMPLPEPPAN